MQNQTVKGFKAMTKDMKCRGFKFKIGSTHKHSGRVVPCESGFHFCREIEDIAGYYPADKCRLFEVKASGTIINDGDKTVTNKLTIVCEIDYNDYINHQHWWVRVVVAYHGCGLDVLCNDLDETVAYVARKIKCELAKG